MANVVARNHRDNPCSAMRDYRASPRRRDDLTKAAAPYLHPNLEDDPDKD